MVALLLPHHAQHVQRARMIWLLLEDTVVYPFRLGDLAALVQCHGIVEMAVLVHD